MAKKDDLSGGLTSGPLGEGMQGGPLSAPAANAAGGLAAAAASIANEQSYYQAEATAADWTNPAFDPNAAAAANQANNDPNSAFWQALRGAGNGPPAAAPAPAPAAAPAAGGMTQAQTEAAAAYAQKLANDATQAQNQQSAKDLITADLQAWGFTPAQSQAVTDWAWGLIAQNTPPGQVLIQLEDPSTPGGQVFYQRFPGMLIQRNNGQAMMSPADYIAYEQHAYQMAQTAGLPAGFMTSDEIGQLIGHNVNPTELDQRLTNGYIAAMNAPPETRQLLHDYFGVDTGHLAAYYLDPEKTVQLLENQTTAAQIGTFGVGSGIGDIGSALAMSLAVNGVTPDQARSQFGQLAPLAPLEHALPGMANTSVTGQELTASGFGVGLPGETAAEAARKVQVTEETRKGGTSGGGGLASSAKGISGAGSASTGAQQGGVQ